MNLKSHKSSSLIFLLVIGFLFIAYFWLQQPTYLTRIQESVSGLKVGSRVEFNGVEVGKVSKIRIDKANAKYVDVFLRINADAPITAGTTAALAVNEAEPGRPFIALSDDGSVNTRLTKSSKEAYPIIPSEPSRKRDVNSALTEIALNLKQFNETVQAFMTKDDIESFRQLIFSAQTVIGMLSENNQRLQRIIVNTESASTKFGSTLQTLQTDTLPATYQLMRNMDNLLNEMDGFMSDIKQNPAILIRGKALPKPGVGE